MPLEDIGRAAPAITGLAESLRRRSLDIQEQGRTERESVSAIELNTLEATKRRNALQEQQRVQAVRGRALDVTTHPMFQGLDPESQKAALGYMSSGGYTDKVGVGTIGSIQSGMQALESNKEAFTSFTSVVIKGKRAAFDMTQKKLNEYIESGKSLDDKAGQLLVQQNTAARNAYNVALDFTGKHLQSLEKQEGASRLATEKAVAVAEVKQKFKLQVDALGGKIGATEERLKSILFKEGKFTSEQQRVWDEIRKTPDKAGFLQKVYIKARGIQFIEEDDIEKIMESAGRYYDDNLAPKGAEPSDATAGMPNPSEHRGKIIKDTDTGKRYKSDGTTWSLI